MLRVTSYFSQNIKDPGLEANSVFRMQSLGARNNLFQEQKIFSSSSC